jgi:hypothetical protein
MDLLDHRLEALAWRCLNRYFEASGDYGAIAVLRHYLVYRAMVRAKIACIRAHQEDAGRVEHGRAEGDFRDHLRLAEALRAPRRPELILMHGVSGSGKTTFAQHLLERLGAVRVRSDVERKRLHGLGAAARTGSAVGAGIYDARSTERTYARLAEVARETLAAGWPAIVDAAFLMRAERDAFRRIAREAGVRFRIVACDAPEAELRRRLRMRARAPGEASEANAAVLARQLQIREPLTDAERADACAPEAVP